MESNKKILKKLEKFEDRLISHATVGPQIKDEEYRQLRGELINDPLLRNKLPPFVRTCRYPWQFWTFITKKSKTHKGRREYLNGKFGPLLAEFEEASQAPSDAPVAEALTALNSDAISKSWTSALERRLDDPDGAITAARTLLESVCKHILDDAGVKYQHSNLPKLYKLTAETLQLAPDPKTETVFQSVLSGCTDVVVGIGSIRNKLGDAHGKGRSSVKPDARHAELAVNVAGAVATFLVQTWEARKA